MNAKNDFNERILLIAPSGNDAANAREVILDAGLEPTVCGGVTEVCSGFEVDGAGAILIAGEALSLEGIASLKAVISNQPPWSDIPLLLLSRAGQTTKASIQMLALFSPWGNVTLLEKPLSPATLVSSLQVALRARWRQYQMRDVMQTQQEALEFNDAVMHNIVEGLYTVNETGLVTFMNPAAEKLFGWTKAELLGKKMHQMTHHTHRDGSPFRAEDWAGLQVLRDGRPVAEHADVFVRKDGSFFDVVFSSSPLRSGGKIRGLVVVFRDLSEEKRAARELGEAKIKLQQHALTLERTVQERTAELKDTNSQLEALVYSIAHDLRAPLRSMEGYAAILQQDHAGQLDEKGKDFVGRIRHSAETMDKLVIDLLAYGRIGRSELTLSEVNVAAVWRIALEQQEEVIEKTHAAIETVLPLPEVWAHAAPLGQILSNLLNNALKFVPPGVQPKVRFWSQKMDGMVRLSLSDNGIGIAPEYHERVFRVFERLHGHRYGGTGIGLSIVRKGVEQMGGRIGVESVPGQGSLFWLELPGVMSTDDHGNREHR